METMVSMMTALNRHVVSNRILLKPGFMDFDRSKSQHITQQQFLRVMKTLNLMPPSDEMFALMIRKYCDRGNNKEVNYFKFCKDVDRPEDMFPAYMAKRPKAPPVDLLGVSPDQVSSFFKGTTHDIDVLNNRFSQPRVEISNDPCDVEERIRACVVMKRVRIEEFFRDFDKLRKGRVTRHQFKSILSTLNFTLTEDEFEALANKYMTNDPERFFRYTDFVANINGAFTTHGIDKAPTTTVAPVTQNDTLLARRKYLSSNPAASNEIEQILDQYRNAVKTMRIHLKPVFQDFDITKNGHVTKAQFLRVLDRLRIYAPEHVLQGILKKYMDKGNIDEVNYVDFCEDVDSSMQLFQVGKDFNQSVDYFPKTQPRVSKAEIVRNTPEDIEDVIARIRAACTQMRIRIGEFFRDFDRLRSGHITASQFRIGMNMAKIPISAPEFSMLLEQFRAPKAGDHICWRDFCD
jgi:Ca2+-binding EF-hand superfamily protein